jgi:hypothetical protein
MTNLYPNPNIGTEAPNSGAPGDAPVPPGTLATGNPQGSQYQPAGVYPPGPQAGAATQTVNSPLSHDLMSRGNIPLHFHPTNAAGPPGTDSLLAQLARGQLILNQSSYGQGSLTPGNGGAGPQAVPAANIVSLPVGIASALNVASPPVYAGN